MIFNQLEYAIYFISCGIASITIVEAERFNHSHRQALALFTSWKINQKACDD